MMNDPQRGMHEPIVSGWSAIEHPRYKGFTDSTVDELYRIIVNLQHSVDTSQLLTLRKQLEDHIADPHAHPVNLVSMKSKVASALFELCQQSGYNGSLEDLLKFIVKDRSIVGSQEDLDAGISQTKAMSVIQWKQWFHEHCSTLGAHMTIRQLLYPYQCTNLLPMLHYDTWIPSTSTVSLKGKWHLTGVSIVFTIDHPVDYTGVLFKVNFTDKELRVEVSLTDMHLFISDEKVATIHYNKALVPSNYMIIVRGDTLVLLDVGNRIEYTEPSHDTIFPEFAKSLTCDGGIGTSHVSSLTIYGRAFAPEEEAFFLR